jgi:hypothetical protein
LFEQGEHDMGRFDELVVATKRQALRIGNRHLKFGSQLIWAHKGQLLAEGLSD